jgi:DNA-binding HxlR family transcriptional regulator
LSRVKCCTKCKYGNYWEEENKRTTSSTGNANCSFEGYDALLLMSETARLRNLITKRGTLEILIPLCCTTNPVRHKQFRQALKGFSTRTLSIRLKELEKSGILERQRYNEIPPRVEYTLTAKGQELVESVVGILQWMRKWDNRKH